MNGTVHGIATSVASVPPATAINVRAVACLAVFHASAPKGSRPWNDHGPRSVTPIPIWRMPVPNTLQYPLERHRDIQRRWQRLLQRPAAPKDRAAPPLKHLRTVARLKMPISAVASSKATS